MEIMTLIIASISNCSSLPITIDEAEIKHNEIKRNLY